MEHHASQYFDTRRLPDFLCVGGRKCATTWLFRCLQDHPEVSVPECKELHFFTDTYEEGIASYAAHFTYDDAARVCGEVSTTYLGHSDAAARIAHHMPNARIIVILREPVERARSHIQHLQTKGRLPDGITTAEAIARFPSIISDGQYASHLKRYLHVFPPSHIHLIFYEDIVHKPERVLRDVYRFVGVSEEHRTKHIHRRYNATRTRKTGIFWWAQRIYFGLLHHAWGRQLVGLLKRWGIRLSLIEGVYGARPCDTHTEREPDMSALACYYHKEIEMLEEITNVSLNEWKRNHSSNGSHLGV